MRVEIFAAEKKYLAQVGAKIEKARLRAGLSQQALAELIGYRGELSIYNIEKAKTKSLNLIVLHRIASVTGVGIIDLL